MRRRTIHALCALFLSFAAAAAPLQAQQRPTLLNFQDSDIAFVLSALAQAAGVGFTYSDLPTKAVTLRTTEPLSREQMLSLIRSIAESNGIRVTEENGVLRLQGSGGTPQEDSRQLYIHRLRHARAPILAQTLQALFNGGGIPSRVTGSGSQTLTQQLNQLQQQQQQVIRAPQVIVAGGQVVGGSGATIVPDDATNSLLVRATPADWLVMQQAIQALDLRPLQVVIEVIIAEVRRTEDLNVGVSVSADASRDGRTTIGEIENPPRDQDFTLRVVRSGDIDIAATLSALAASGNVRVLSRPIVVAQNNLEASITVGQERPFVQVSRGVGNVPGGQPFAEDVVQYRDVATTLSILPTINEDGYVNLAVTQEVNTATSEVQFGAPVISTRSAVTQLLARDGQTVVLGGLIERQQDRSRGGIPFLKDIPLLGALFGNTRHNDVNSELFLFLTPHIVEVDEDADRVKQELENNADLLRPLTPIRPIIPPDTTRTPPPEQE